MILEWAAIEKLIGDEQAIENMDEHFIPVFCPEHQAKGFANYRKTLLDPSTAPVAKLAPVRKQGGRKRKGGDGIIRFGGQASSNQLEQIKQAVSKKGPKKIPAIFMK